MAPEYCKISVSCTAVFILLSVIVHSAAQRLPQNCSYYYLIVPNSQPDCNPVDTSEVVDLLCFTTVRAAPPTQIYWYWSPFNESAGISGTQIAHDGIKYFVFELKNEDRDMVGYQEHRSRLRVVDFGGNDTGYYWCQIIVECVTPMQPSQPAYRERNDSLEGCRLQDRFTNVGSLCADLDPTTTTHISTSVPVSVSLSPSITPFQHPADTDTQSDILLVWQLLAGGLSIFTVLLVLMLVGVIIQYKRWKKRTSSQQPPLQRSRAGLSNVLSRHQMAAKDQETRGQEQLAQNAILSDINVDRNQDTLNVDLGRLDRGTLEQPSYSNLEESQDTKYDNVSLNEAAKYQPLCVETLDSTNSYTSTVKMHPLTVVLKDGEKEYCICDQSKVDKPRVYQLLIPSSYRNQENTAEEIYN